MNTYTAETKGTLKGIHAHHVQKGDTILSISRFYDVSENNIIETNNLEETTLTEGQILVIKQYRTPNLPEYKVNIGDSLSGLAKRFRHSERELRELNGLRSDAILPNQTLKLFPRDVVRGIGFVMSVIDLTHIEVLLNKESIVLEVSYGSSSLYESYKGKEVIIYYVKGKQSALVSLTEKQ